MSYTTRDLQRALNNNGHLHLFLDSGAEAAVSRHDTTVEDGEVVVDSKAGHWRFPIEAIEFVDVEPSEVHPP